MFIVFLQVNQCSKKIVISRPSPLNKEHIEEDDLFKNRIVCFFVLLSNQILLLFFSKNILLQEYLQEYLQENQKIQT